MDEQITDIDGAIWTVHSSAESSWITVDLPGEPVCRHIFDRVNAQRLIAALTPVAGMCGVCCRQLAGDTHDGMCPECYAELATWTDAV